jgi:tRNA-splicing ligase RtcB (3'-phosphate/5'-hydroxy nucleic acid ligase)
VDLFRDEDGWLWVGVHFGSRGFGHKTASGFLAMAAEEKRRKGPDRTEKEAAQRRTHLDFFFDEHARDGEMDSPPILFDVGTGLGDSYIEAMTLAGQYAYAGREVVVEKVLEILQAEMVEEVHNHHNFAWRENHGGRVCGNCAGYGTAFAQKCPYPDEGGNDVYMVAAGGRCKECGGSGRVAGEDVWVVRKGATPAFPGQKGFVGATMGEPSVILEGIESDAGASLFHSTVHGAGRVMSRTQAAGKVKRFNVWECNDRDCSYRAPRDRQPPERYPCPDHPNGRLLKRKVEEQMKAGLIDFSVVREELDVKGIELRGAAADEAPGAYKRLDAVLDAHSDTIRILHTLTPIGVAMAGADVVDPFKD